ncbi:sulfatase family protein [Roseimaritima sediminicola]|uniref:sulfatase family protein n=1 Tax=Roseimaritima sediminicola TaxID=2662066 RepID=UPI0012984098|nr:sulfatase [Roseimaritima sediminicola]
MLRVFAGLLLAATLAPLGVAADGDRPNILYIMSDDHGYQALSCYGSEIIDTPHMDRIAKEGMRFDRAFVTNSICGPSRAVMLTGKHSHINGFTRNGKRFDGSQPHLGKYMRQAGYQTAVIGKWHLGTDPTGFDYYHVLRGQGPYYNPNMLTSNGPVQHTGYTTDIITDVTLNWLKEQRNEDEPFMLIYQHKAPHRNWMPGPDHLNDFDDVTIPEPDTLFDDYSGRTSPARNQTMTIAEHLSPHDLKLVPQRRLNEEQTKVWNEAYEEKNRKFREANLTGKDLVRWKYQRYVKDYLRCVQSVDDNVGRVLDYLDESGLAENTIVVYTSDQGWYLGEHGWYDKRWMYEESFRTPLMVRWPGKIQPGSTSDQMVMNLDFAPTLLDAAGLEVPEDMQGKSFVPVLDGSQEGSFRDAVYYHYYEFPGPHSVAKHYGVRTDRYKLIHFYDVGTWELFDLEKDPKELTSVYDAPQYAEVQADLKEKLKELREQYQVID